MKCWHGCLILSFLIVGTVGCKTPGNTEALQRELRYQEDMIYQLQDYIRTYKCYLEECRQENETSRKQAAGSESPSALKQNLHPDVHLAPPNAQRLDGERLDGGRIKPPVIELPKANKGAAARLSPDLIAAAYTEKLYDTQPITTHWTYPLPKNVTLARYQESILRDPSVPTPLGPSERINDSVIVSFPLNKGYAGGYREDKNFGGIWLLLSPRNAAGQKIRPCGELSVALINPRAYSTEKARVANWKFSPSQMELITEDLPVGESLLLELPWSGEPPLDSLLQVYVRLITPEGNEFLVDQRIDLAQKEPLLKGEQAGESPGWRKRTRPRDFSSENNFIVPQTPQQKVSRQHFDRQHLTPETPEGRQNVPGDKRRAEWKPYR